MKSKKKMYITQSRHDEKKRRKKKKKKNSSIKSNPNRWKSLNSPKKNRKPQSYKLHVYVCMGAWGPKAL